MKVQTHISLVQTRISNFGTQQGSDVFHKSSLVMTFLSSLGVVEILCSFRLSQEGGEGKEIRVP